jgi:hypothetical protein
LDAAQPTVEVKRKVVAKAVCERPEDPDAVARGMLRDG